MPAFTCRLAMITYYKRLASQVARIVYGEATEADTADVEAWLSNGDPQAVAIVTTEDAAAQYREWVGLD